MLNRYLPLLLVCLLLVSCRAKVPDEKSSQVLEPPPAKQLLEAASKFSQEVLAERLRLHYSEYQRGNVGAASFFESDDLIGYTTYSNERYQETPSPIDLQDCILFVAEFRNEESAEKAFDHLKENSQATASDVEGMVGISPVQIRFMEKIRNDGGGGLFAHQGNIIFFLTENGAKPTKTESWNDYEALFLESIPDGSSMDTFQLR